jgi:hypothetical protein
MEIKVSYFSIVQLSDKTLNFFYFMRRETSLEVRLLFPHFARNVISFSKTKTWKHIFRLKNRP